ncbi:MAG TPA: SPOR domain-containing protein [Gemmatimonadaceae bacterium]|nr:SPOR domain-containing protein [Gemmatimonadaceae bacterium]
MRTPLLALVVVLAGCSTADDRGASAASTGSLGPDAIVLRIPAQGGVARAYRYPALDSALWSTKAPLPSQVRPLAFNIDLGTLVLEDTTGVPWRLTLGSGLLERAHPKPLGVVTSLDGSGIFGTSDGSVLRLTTNESKPWQVSTVASPSQLQPLRDGGVLLIGQRGAETVLTRFRPPSTTAVDSAVIDGRARLISAAGGDRYYLSDGPNRLVSFRARDLERLGTIALGDSIVATASSPSGDRVYVLGQDGDESHVQVINKYADQVVATIAVPSDASALRMDPLGRYLLVRHAAEADSVLVIGIATNAVVGRFVSPWRADLPLVFPDGRLATLRGDDVVTLTADQFRPVAVTVGGAKDIWTVVQWNGFRTRDGDAPLRATAAQPDTTRRRAVVDTAARAAAVAALNAVGDTGLSDADAARRRAKADSLRRGLRPDTSRRLVPPVDSPPRPVPATRPEPPSVMGERGTFIVQFAALKAERPAQQLASSIRANGERARVVVTSSNGIALYRVILGPFRSRTDAEQAGQAAGRDYWVFEGGSN